MKKAAVPCLVISKISLFPAPTPSSIESHRHYNSRMNCQIDILLSRVLALMWLRVQIKWKVHVTQSFRPSVCHFLQSRSCAKHSINDILLVFVQEVRLPNVERTQNPKSIIIRSSLVYHNLPLQVQVYAGWIALHSHTLSCFHVNVRGTSQPSPIWANFAWQPFTPVSACTCSKCVVSYHLLGIPNRCVRSWAGVIIYMQHVAAMFHDQARMCRYCGVLLFP